MKDKGKTIIGILLALIMVASVVSVVTQIGSTQVIYPPGGRTVGPGGLIVIGEKNVSFWDYIVDGVNKSMIMRDVMIKGPTEDVGLVLRNSTVIVSATGYFDTQVVGLISAEYYIMNRTTGTVNYTTNFTNPRITLEIKKPGTDETINSVLKGESVDFNLTTNLEAIGQNITIIYVVVDPVGVKRKMEVNLDPNGSNRYTFNGTDRIGTYTVYAETNKSTCNGLDVKSPAIIFKVVEAGVDIKAEKTSALVFEKVRLTVMGVPSHSITISSSDPAHTIFPAGYEDNPYSPAIPFNDTIDEDGKRMYVVYFNATGTYTIKVTDTTANLTDSVNIEMVTGDLLIDDNETFIIKNCTYTQTGNILVKDNGTLIIKNATLFMNLTTDWEYSIRIYNHGQLVVENSDIATNILFDIYFFDMATGDIVNSTIGDGWELGYVCMNCLGNSTISMLNSTTYYIRASSSFSNLTITTSNIENMHIYWQCCTLSITGLRSGKISYWSSYQNTSVVGYCPNVTIYDSIVGWEEMMFDMSNASVTNSEIGNIWCMKDSKVTILYHTGSWIHGISGSEVTIRNTSGLPYVYCQSGKVHIFDSSIDTIWCEGNSNVTLFNSTYESVYKLIDGDQIHVYWYLTVYVSDQNTNPINNASVIIYNNASEEVFNGSTNENGCVDTEIQEYTLNKTTKIIYTPHNITVTKDSFTNSSISTISESKMVAIVLQVSEGFDTRPGIYPSIFGTHNGTITPNRTISVSKLYTYPCTGTGGHSEYAAFYYSNGTKIAEAHWNGYQSDWHNITFDKTVVLLANETYNYTIRTGSYPQIHHTGKLEVASGTGTITCEEFTDANGKRYNDWIPAIRLGG